MYRTVYYLGLVVFVCGVLGLIVPQSAATLTFFLPNGLFAIMSLVLATILLHFAVFGYFRKDQYKQGFGLGGTALVLVALLGLLDPSALGMTPLNFRPASALMLLIMGIGFCLAAIEYNRLPLFEELTRVYNFYTLKLATKLLKTSKKAGHKTARVSTKTQ